MIIKKQLLLFVMMLLPMVAMADAVEIDGIYYNLITKGKVAEVTRNPNNYSGSVIIPDKITFEETEYMVTNIGLAAFEWSSALISIIIPNSVTTIGNEAFWGCESLTTIKIPNSVTSIGQYAFSGCNGLESIDLPNGITSVSEGAFQNCTSLTSIIIPTNVTSIGYKAFIGCTSLASITIGNNVTSIGEYAFLGTGLTSISIPNSVVSIGGWAFSDCIGLTSITIPNNVKGIGGYAFRGCSSLTSIILGSGLQSLGYGTFASCPVLIDVYSYAEYAPFAPSDAFEGSYIEYVTLHVPARSIDEYKAAEPWKNFKNIVKIDMPEHSLIYMIDNEVYKLYQIEEGEMITPEPSPTKEGYTFSGWSEIPEIMPSHDVTVTGSFNINSYKLTYVVDGVEYKTVEVEYNSAITPETEPTKEGHTFRGWSEIPETMPSHDVTVTGTFSINSYKLTYMIDDKVYKETIYEYGATITPEPQPEGDYATFEWTNLPQTMPAHDVVVYASYTTGIIDVLMSTQSNLRIYSPNGKKLEKLQKGLNIVILDNGTVKKVEVK